MIPRTRGYTVVELMMALTVLSIGVSGVIAMQKVTVSSNQHAKNLGIATHLAEAWAEQLTADSSLWNAPNATTATSDLGDTVWLAQVTANNGVWFRPGYSATLNFGPAFDVLGTPMANGAAAPFCTDIRLSWVYPQTASSGFNGLIRADIRVFWSRAGATINCNLLTPNTVTGSRANYHVVHHSTAIRQNN